MQIKRIQLVELQNMASSEVLGMIEPGVLSLIKSRDPHPQFRVYSIAHEGESHGTVIGLGTVALRWLQNAISKIVEKISIGTKLFFGHVPGTNRHEGRVEVGEVVGKAERTIDGIQNALTVAYIAPEHRDKNFDVASFESDVLLPDDIKNNPVVDPSRIGKITGIAVGNSENMSPAFKGAVLQTALQMSEENGDDKMELTFEQVLKYVKESGIKPGALYDSTVLAEDEAVQNLIKDGNKNTWYQITRLKEENQDLKDKLEKSDSDLAKENKDLKSKLNKLSSATRKDELLEDRKLTDEQKKFINRNFKKFDPDGEKEIDDELNSWLDGQVDEFKSLQEDGIIPKTVGKASSDTYEKGASENTEEIKKGTEQAEAELDGDPEE